MQLCNCVIIIVAVVTSKEDDFLQMSFAAEQAQGAVAAHFCVHVFNLRMHAMPQMATHPICMLIHKYNYHIYSYHVYRIISADFDGQTLELVKKRKGRAQDQLKPAGNQQFLTSSFPICFVYE